MSLSRQKRCAALCKKHKRVATASLGKRLYRLDGITIDPYPIPSNLIMIDLSPSRLNPQVFVDRLQHDYQIVTHIYGKHLVRLAIHRHIGQEEEVLIVDAVKDCLDKIFAENKKH
jgi:hypothetical protein